MKHKLAKRLLLIIAAIVLVSCAAVGIYAADYYRMDTAAVAALADSDTVTVETRDGMAIFSPAFPKAGLVFYPGGKVEYTAYAPLMHALAENGILCVIPEMPLNLAVLDVHAAEDILPLFPDIDTWYIGGHSLGGSMAASHAAASDDFTGLILLAAYSTADLTATDLQVLSVYGSRDGVLNMEKYSEYFPNLPDNTTEIILDGGNHAQFGSYGEQEGDGTATLTPKEQLSQTTHCIMELLGREPKVICSASVETNGETCTTLIAFDSDAKQFTIYQPVYSSAYLTGSYTVENDILTATTTDHWKTYRFRITEENELMYLAEGSSELTAYSTYDGPQATQSTIPDGTIFRPASVWEPK